MSLNCKAFHTILKDSQLIGVFFEEKKVRTSKPLRIIQ
jgi:hypothetical protein